MFGLSRLHTFIGGGIAVLLLALAVWGHLKGDARVRAERDDLKATVETSVEATKEASGNPDVTAETMAGQIRALGESNRTLKIEIDNTNRALDDMAREAKQAKAKAAELQRIVDRAIAQRDSALRELSDMALTPGTRDDLLTLVQEANDALDILRESGA